MAHRLSPFVYRRRPAREVMVGDPARGGVVIGGNHPVVRQSMLTADTLDTAACVQQTLDLVAAGCQMVRLATPTVNDAANLQHVVAALRARGCQVPIVADVHFKPEAALEAAKWVEKVRVNPGNYADSKKFAVRDYTDAQYAAELQRIEERFAPLVKRCRELGRAMRIGVNHGSLSDRILNRFGDTPQGMVESALEFARIARLHGFHNLVFSLKSSNPKVMIHCYRLLAARLEELGPDWNYPLHLGVTEAGEGEDGRIKSAIGIGSLLCDGLGDTIRVSLTEDSPREIPVCNDLLALVPALTLSAEQGLASEAASPGCVAFSRGGDGSSPRTGRGRAVPAPSSWSQCVPVLASRLPMDSAWPVDPLAYERRQAAEIALAPGLNCGGQQPVRVVVERQTWAQVAPALAPDDLARPEAIYEDLPVCEIDPTADFRLPGDTQFVTVRDGVEMPTLAAFRLLAARLKQLGRRNPILLKDRLDLPGPSEHSNVALLRASVVLGSLLADGIGDAILVRAEADRRQSLRLAYNILQAAGCRAFKTDYVACPSCGRTLFDLQAVTARIKARTQHLAGVKIAIMGCIVNGPGEMADADFGYVGGGPGKVNLYVGKQPVRFGIPEAEAVERLVDLIREHGRWREPPR